MTTEFGRRRFVGIMAGTAALGVAAAGIAALGQEDWFSPDERTEGTEAPLTADPEATADAQSLLKWFRELPKRDARRVVSGQQIDNITLAAYEQYVGKLADRTGKHVAMVGVGIHEPWTRTEYRVLTDHWKAGGLITIDIHPSNPWVPNGGPQSAWVTDAKATKPDLRTLLQTSDASPQRTAWRGQLERLGDILEELGRAGVVVLLRPLHESNGSWFWWGQDMATRKTTARDLYRDIFFYLTQGRNLHNLLWVYSPAPSWDGPVMSYYPGPEFVDIISPSRYDDQMLMYGDAPNEEGHTDFQDVLAAGKPLGFGECGPSRSRDGSWDSRTIINRIRTKYPQMTYFHVWHGWENTVMELVKSKHVEELLNDPWVITRENIDWRPKPSPTTGTSPTSPTKPTPPSKPTPPAKPTVTPTRG